MMKRELEKEIWKCEFCNKKAVWITNDVFDIRMACQKHKLKLEKAINEKSKIKKTDDSSR